MKKKILAVSILLLAISMLFILTNTVKAATATIEKVESLSGGNVEAKDNVYTITLTKDDVNKLEWHAIDDPTYQEGVDRVANGWDVGFKVTFSEEITKGDLKAEYTDVEGITKTNPSCTPDTNPKEYSAWVSLNENKLEGKKETFQLAKFVFTIGTETKTVIINIDPTDVKLKVPEDGRMVKVTVYGYESTYEFTMEKDKTLSNNKENGGLVIIISASSRSFFTSFDLKSPSPSR